jgi:5-methyltetrahydropteroyltriglutamate--homocysteine methyltransferase
VRYADGDERMDIPVLPTQEIGSFRKPEYLLEAYKAFFDRRIRRSQLNNAIKKASLETLRLLEEVGLDIVYDGEMHRWEMYHHPIVNINGIELIGQVRVFDNRYFIKGSVKRRISFKRNYYLDEFLFIRENTDKPIKVPVTGPYTLADWSYNEYYLRKYMGFTDDLDIANYNAKRELCIELARKIINPIARELSEHGSFRIQIDEPAATTHPNEMDIFVEAFNEAVKGVNSVVTTHICYSDYTVLLPHIFDIDVAQFAIELANRDNIGLGVEDEARPGYGILKEFAEYGYEGEIGLGVVDVHTDFIEPVELIRDRILYALRYIPPEKLFINPDCGLRTRRRELAAKKLRNMVAAVRLVRDELGV